MNNIYIWAIADKIWIIKISLPAGEVLKNVFLDNLTLYLPFLWHNMKVLYCVLLNYCWPSALLFLHSEDRTRQLTYTNIFLQIKGRSNISNFKAWLESLVFLTHRAPATFRIATPINIRSRLMRISCVLKHFLFGKNYKVIFLTHISHYHYQSLTKYSILSLASSLRIMDVVWNIPYWGRVWQTAAEWV